jgi:transmembrane sensor
MSEDDTKLGAALVATDSEWTSADTEHGLRLLRRRVRGRRLARRAAIGGLAVVALAGAVVLVVGRVKGETAVPPVRVGAALRFADGSLVTPLDPSTIVSVGDARPERIALVVERGHATFEVAPNPRRVFRAEAGSVSVEALGTAFSVERRGQLVGVSVQHGRVRVAWPSGVQELGAGMSGWYPPPAIAAKGPNAPSELSLGAGGSNPPVAISPGGSNPPVAISPGGSNPPAASSGDPRSTWRTLAARGDNASAYQKLTESGVRVMGADDLLLAADVARLSGHPSEAASYLERFLGEHGSDGRASVAAFSLGHLLMNRLGRPAEAARRFAEARRRTRGDSVAEDSLAREVEAWSRAGDKARAKSIAEEYLRIYPNGHRAKAVRTFGGLE